MSSILLVISNNAASNNGQCYVWEFYETKFLWGSGSGDRWMDKREPLRRKVLSKTRAK